PLPLPPLLNTGGGGSQGDIGTCPVSSGTTLAGFLYTLWVSDIESHEYWMLLPNYRTPTTDTDIVRVGGPLIFDPPDGFANLFDHADQPMWTSTCTLMVARCQYFTSMPTGTGPSDAP